MRGGVGVGDNTEALALWVRIVSFDYDCTTFWGINTESLAIWVRIASFDYDYAAFGDHQK